MHVCRKDICIWTAYVHVCTLCIYACRYICRTQQELREGKGREGLEEIDSSNFDS